MRRILSYFLTFSDSNLIYLIMMFPNPGFVNLSNCNDRQRLKSRETEGAKKRLGKKGNPFPIWTYPRIDWLSSFRQFES